jgi:TonB-linked SusC/RagA family outer membrane protein
MIFMDATNRPKPVIILFLLFVLFSVSQTFAQNEAELKNKTIVFSKTELTLKQALDELNKLQGMSVVYGNNEEMSALKVTFPARSITVQQAIAEIERQAPVDIIFDNNHFIVKKRKLEKKYKLSGSVKDARTNEALVSADVCIFGSTTAVNSDKDGNFSMQLASGVYQVVFRYLGYNEKRVEVHLYQNDQVDVQLEVKQHFLNGVDVFGKFNSVEAFEKGRTITTIESKTIDRLNVNSVNDALLGRVNGVWTTKVSGAPGDHYKIRIRGISSIFGCTDPLYVVDGAIISIVNFENLGIADLNSHDIENITVLKDASSTALYGNLGGNGVIIIETKKGGGESHLNFSYKQGFQDFSKRYPLMNAETFLNTLQRSDTLIGTEFYKVDSTKHQYEKYPLYRDSLGNALTENDFQDELFRTGHISEYQLSGSGNFKTIDYYISGNYYNHTGIITNSDYEKYTLTTNLSKVIGDKISFRLLYKGSHQKNRNNLDNYLGNNVIFKGINYEPAYRSTPDSFFMKYDRLYYNDVTNPSVAILSDANLSPDKLFYQHDKIKTDVANTLNLQGFYQISKEFSFRAEMSMAARNQNYSSNLQKSISSYQNPNSYIEYYQSFSNEKILTSDETFLNFCQQYDLKFLKEFKNHQINAFIRYRGFYDNAYWAVDSIANVDLDGIKPEDDVYLRGSQAIYGEQGSVLRSINSGIFNLNYNFKKKYFVSFISNYEVLKEQEHVNKGQFFNSLALNWDLAKERIFHFPAWIDEFSLYVNAGNAGNYPLNSLADNLFSFSSQYTAMGENVNTAYISNLANQDLRNEKVIETNYGAELSLFKSRIILRGDYYEKTNSDLLIRRTIPLYYGGGFIYQNIGEMKNSGLELGLELTPVRTPTFYWNMRFGYSTNNQFISKLNQGESIKFNDTDILIPDFIAKENEPLGAISGYSYQGKTSDLPKADFAGKKPKYINNMGLAYLKIDSLNPTKLTPADKTIIGNSIPDFTFNWMNMIEYRNFTCEMLWYGSVGVDKYNATRAATYIAGTNSDVRNIVLDKMNYHTGNVFYESSYFVEDASFVRLKTLSFSYRQAKKIASKISLEYTLSFENLVTLTRYSGYDPESTIYTNNNFTDNAIDRGAYPSPRGVFFSINMTL